MAINREEVIQAAEKQLQRGRIDGAIKEYAKVVAESPNDHNTLNKIGDLYQRLNKPGDSVRHWIQAADVLRNDGFNVRAIAMYRKVLRNDATRLDAMESLADLLHKERLVNEARTQYQVLADYYLKHARTNQAVAVLEKMAELEPENPSHHVKLAELFVKLRQPERALGEYRVIAQTMLRHGHAEEAGQVYMRALDIGAQDLEFIGQAVSALRDANQAGSAARFLAAAIEKNPDAEQFSRISAPPRPPGSTPKSGSRPAVVEPPPPPPPPPPRDVEQDDSVLLTIDLDEPPPPTQIMPPPDMPAGRFGVPAPPPPAPPAAAPAAFEEIEIEIESLESVELPDLPPASRAVEPPAPPSGGASAAPGGLDFDAPLEIDWSFAELPEPELPPELMPAPPQPPPAAAQIVPASPGEVLQPFRLDEDALERTAAEVQPSAVRRDEDLIAEAEVLAKYGLKEKALDRVREALQVSPRHLGAHELSVSLFVDLGRPDRALAALSELRRLAEAAGNLDAWERARHKVQRAGLAEGLTTAPERGRDEVSRLVDSLAAPSKPAPSPVSAAPPAAKPAKRGKVDDALAALASSVQPKKKAKPAPPPEVEAAPPALHIVPPQPQVEPPKLAAPVEPPPVADEVAWLEEVAPAAPAAAAADEKLFEDEAQFFDLAAELEKELGDEVVAAAAFPQQQEQSLEEIVEGFKKGVAENLSAEDYDTHFNLGIAYREMGLLDEAIGEFQLASKAPAYLVECCAMLGICFLDKGLPELAVKWYRRALETPGLPEEQQLGLLYDLGTAQLAAGDRDTAYKTFVDIYGVNSNYRDVVARLEELGPR